MQAAGGCPTSLRPGRWLDLYSGTGSVGIEAISRGCSQVIWLCLLCLDETNLSLVMISVELKSPPEFCSAGCILNDADGVWFARVRIHQEGGNLTVFCDIF